ncbi:MAG: AraC family transcriptional regulator [Roseibium sp.]
MVSQVACKTPLKSFRRFQSSDVDEAQDIVARHFCSHRLERNSAKDRFDACQNRVAGHGVSLNYIRYGADVTIEPGELSNFYLIQIPLAGTALVKNGCQTVDANATTGSVLNPDRLTSMRWHAGCEQLLVQVDRKFLRDVATNLAGLSSDCSLRFKPSIDLRKPALSNWFRSVRAAVKTAEDGAAFQSTDGPLQRHLEEGLVTAFLEAQPNTLSPLLERPEGLTTPAILKRSLAYINECFAENISLLDICIHAGTTPRNLQLVFRRELGCSPIQCLQNVRLGFARHLLLSGGLERSVSDIADQSGHRHLGRFSVAYKKRFGETPRATTRSRQYC